MADDQNAYFERVDAMQGKLLELKKLDVLAETMEVNDLSRRYSSMLFFVLSIILGVVALVMINVIGVQSSFPNLFCWWNNYYVPATKQKGCRTSQPTGMVPDVTATGLALAYAYPAIFHTLNALTVYSDIPASTAAFLMVCVQAQGPSITPIHWRGTGGELGYSMLSQFWLPVNKQAVLATAPYLVKIWDKCPAAKKALRKKVADVCFDKDTGSVREECLANDLRRIFSDLPDWSVSTDLTLCNAWKNWLYNGCPPNDFEDYPLLPWNHKVWDLEDKESFPRVKGAYGWPIGWNNSQCANPFFNFFPHNMESDALFKVDEFFEVASVLKWLTESHIAGPDQPATKTSDLSILYDYGLVGLGMTLNGTNTHMTADDFYNYMFAPDNALINLQISTDCDSLAGQDGISAGLAIGTGLSMFPTDQLYKEFRVKPKMTAAWRKALDDNKITDVKITRLDVAGRRGSVFIDYFLPFGHPVLPPYEFA